jgi:2,3-bisphosphoglycerate-independent phosphoglycerate mutase
MVKKAPGVLVIMDGWGEAPASRGNAIKLARTSNLDKLSASFPKTFLRACGKDVGLPVGIVSGSETGHENIGAGRVVEQAVTKISAGINSGTFFKNPVLVGAMRYVNFSKERSLHLMGLVGPGTSPHSDIDHLLALLVMAKRFKVERVYLHLFSDGRDSKIRGALEYFQTVENFTKELGVGKIATISGRYFAMDRNKKWERTRKAYEAIVNSKAERARSWQEAFKRAYERGFTDEFIPPTWIENEKSEPVARVREEDAVIFFNFRSDRARQLTKSFTQEDFSGFEREDELEDIFFVAMTDFGPDLPLQTAFLSMELRETLPIALKNFRQLYVAETEKYAHVTFFLNGGYADPVAGEERIQIPSPDVSSYAQVPEMSAFETTEKVCESLRNKKHDFITLNLANPDMLGHTGDLLKVVKACEVVDECVGKIAKEVLRKNGFLVVTSDHGNADEMYNLETGEISVEHSKNPVPFMLIGEDLKKIKLKDQGVLAQVAPTIFEVFGVERPGIYKDSLIIK